MAFRTIVVDTHSKLEYSLNYLIFRTPDVTKRVLLDEVHTLIVQSTAVSLTTSLISELSKRKVKVIFCDEKAEPACELSPFYGSHNCAGRVLEQVNWPFEHKEIVWKRIVEEKIMNQAKSLQRKGKIEEFKLLSSYAKEVQPGDATNREGHAAKVYFNAIYFKGFTRDKECELNKYLDYGYTILLAQFNRAITSAGYLTQLGIHHKSEFNQFNLGCDLMEPFRFVIDDFVATIKEEDDWKDKLIGLLGSERVIAEKTQTLVNAIGLYCQSVFTALSSGKVLGIRFLNNDL